MFVIAVLAMTIGFSWAYWDELRVGESLSATIRNVGLVAGGILGIGLALWRSVIAKLQADTAYRVLANDSLQRAVEMVDADQNEAMRVAGVLGLGRLAEEDPERYNASVLQLLEELFLRDEPSDGLTLEIAVRYVVAECRERLPKRRLAIARERVRAFIFDAR